MTDIADQFFSRFERKPQPARTARRFSGTQSDALVALARHAAAKIEARSLSRRINLVLKRLSDIAISGSALAVLAPFLLIVALLIRLESPGPALFVQERWGLRNRKIRIYKFRSMYTDRCDISGVRQTEPGDPRITPLGRIIRRSNIDELPQLLNVLKGDLSLVGPRCHAVGMLAAGIPYDELVPDYHARHLMRPGITGLAQIRGFRGPTTNIDPAMARIAYDLTYLADFNIWMDIKILFLTFVREIKGGTGF